ncbi:MAG: heavy-metal-associated domain-containing protein [Bacteroidota bacterium]
MKKVMIVMNVIFFAFLSAGLHAQNADNNGEVILKTEMDCGSCASKVEKQLSFTKGVKNVKTDYVKDEVWIKYRSDKTTPEKLITSLDEIGYEAEVKGKKQNADDNKKSACPGAAKSGCPGKTPDCGTKSE